MTREPMFGYVRPLERNGRTLKNILHVYYDGYRTGNDVASVTACGMNFENKAGANKTHVRLMNRKHDAPGVPICGRCSRSI